MGNVCSSVQSVENCGGRRGMKPLDNHPLGGNCSSASCQDVSPHLQIDYLFEAKWCEFAGPCKCQAGSSYPYRFHTFLSIYPLFYSRVCRFFVASSFINPFFASILRSLTLDLLPFTCPSFLTSLVLHSTSFHHRFVWANASTEEKDWWSNTDVLYYNSYPLVIQCSVGP